MIKDLAGWTLKKETHSVSPLSPPYCEPREVWWVALGVNVGAEEDGEGPKLIRPVLIMQTFGSLFYALPLSTTDKRGPFYYPFIVTPEPGDQGDLTESVGLLTQLRALDTRRLRQKVGVVGWTDYEAIRAALVALLLR